MVCIYYRVGNGNRNRITRMVIWCTNHCAIPTFFEQDVGIKPRPLVGSQVLYH